MSASRYTIMSFEEHPESEFSLEQTAELTGLHPEMILEFLRAELVRVAAQASEGSPSFDQSAIVRLRHIAVLQHEHVNLRTIRYIVRLIDRLETTDRELRALRERIR